MSSVSTNLKTKISIKYAILLVVVFCFPPVLKAETKFKVIPIASKKVIPNQALSQGRITDILEDSRGFMWFSTIDGLNRYDGYNVKIFRHKKNDSNSISSNQINRIIEDAEGFIWIATTNGLNKFDPYLEVFYHYQCPITSSNSTEIKDIVIDHHQNIWFGTLKGLFTIRSGENIIQHIPLDHAFFPVHRLLVDSENQLWIGSNGNSIKRYNIDSKTISYFSFPNFIKTDFSGIILYEDSNKYIWFSMFMNIKNDKYINTYYYQLGEDKIKQFNQFNDVIFKNNLYGAVGNIGAFESKDGELWITSNTSGLTKFDFKNNEVVSFPDYITHNWHEEIGKTELYFDSRGLLWVGTTGDGVFILPKNSNEFNLVNTEIYKHLTVKSIRSFCEDEEFFWLSGYFGVARMSKNNGEITNLNNDKPVYTINNYPGDDKFLLLGIEGGGIQKINKKTGVFKNISPSFYSNQKNNLQWQWVFSTYIENDSTCWLGCMNGIIKIDFQNKTSTPYFFNGDDEPFLGNILCLYRDFSGELWAASEKRGLAIFSDSLNQFIQFKSKIPRAINIENIRVNSIMQTKDSVYWMGTSEGLLKIGPHEIHLYTEGDHLPNDFVYGVLEDEKGNLWLSTNNGICSFNPTSLEVKSYTTIEGLQNKEFNTGAYYKAKDGQMFFGGIKGFNHFYPSKISQSESEIRMALTGIKWYNEYIKLEKTIIEKGKIIIPPDIEYFSVEFSGLNYLNSLGNLYKYKINEFNEDWISLGKKHEISFHSLKPGTYHLQILAANSHRKWNKNPLKLEIIVQAYYWETIGFRIIVLLLIIGFATIIIRHRFKNIKAQKAQVENLVKERTEELQKANHTKNQFFSIISHDLKNPLGAAQSVSNELKENVEDYDPKEIKILVNILDSAIGNLGKLLSNLLTWSRVQQNMIASNPEKLPLHIAVHHSLVILAQNINEKQIKTEVHIDKNIEVFADKDLLSAIIRNIISNAIKFTSDKGNIQISAKVKNETVFIQFKDSGIGMSDETIKKLFIPGKNISTAGTNRELGTGMGLLLIKDFVKLNNGEVWVRSKLGEGSTFFVSLPGGVS